MHLPPPLLRAAPDLVLIPIAARLFGVLIGCHRPTKLGWSAASFIAVVCRRPPFVWFCTKRSGTSDGSVCPALLAQHGFYRRVRTPPSQSCALVELFPDDPKPYKTKCNALGRPPHRARPARTPTTRPPQGCHESLPIDCELDRVAAAIDCSVDMWRGGPVAKKNRSGLWKLSSTPGPVRSDNGRGDDVGETRNVWYLHHHDVGVLSL
jgi:hypothetical protein